MKIRSGFVSNSSSSSFVIFSKTKLDTVDKLKKFIGVQFPTERGYSGNPDYLAEDKAKYLLEIDYYKIDRSEYDSPPRMQEIDPSKLEKVLKYESWRAHPKCLSHEFNVVESKIGWYSLYSSGIDEKSEAYKILEKAGDKAHKAAVKDLANKLRKIFKNHHIYLIEAGDQDGSTGSETEHGGTFDLVPHLRKSNH